MKKFYILMVAVILAATACNKKSKDLIYNGENPITIALRDTTQLSIKSDYDVTLTSSDNNCATVLNGGKVYGKNVGEAKITMDNGYNSVTIPVNVVLFKEPTFNFGCTAEEIIRQHGEPDYNYGDTILRYTFVSYTCPDMIFYLKSDKKYYESDLYITKNSEYLLGKYFEEKYVLDSVYTVDGKERYMYHNKIDSSIGCGKIANVNQWEEFCLFYFGL